MTIQTLDDLPLLAEGSREKGIGSRQTPRKLNKAQRTAQDERDRSEAQRQFNIEFGLRSGLRFYSLPQVQRMWFEEQAKLAVEHARDAARTANPDDFYGKSPEYVAAYFAAKQQEPTPWPSSPTV